MVSSVSTALLKYGLQFTALLIYQKINGYQSKCILKMWLKNLYRVELDDKGTPFKTMQTFGKFELFRQNSPPTTICNFQKFSNHLLLPTGTVGWVALQTMLTFFTRFLIFHGQHLGRLPKNFRREFIITLSHFYGFVVILDIQVFKLPIFWLDPRKTQFVRKHS